MRVLFVEDNEKFGRILCTVLEKEGIGVDWAKNAGEAFDYFNYSKNNLYDVVILDWMLPGKSGPEICSALRSAKYAYHGGILFLTARDAVEDRVIGLEAGSDDYLPKPFENAELIARLKALSRRKNKPYVDDTLFVAGVKLNRTEHKIHYGGRVIELSPREFEVFDLLMINFEKILPRNTIIENIWGMDSDISSANLDSYIYLLRKKLKSIEHIAITLSRGIGYKVGTA